MTKRSLLLVDGDAKSLRVLEVSLKKAGFNVTAAASGATALETLQNSLPDLVISDTEMPEMDGYAFCREFKSNPEWADIPFVFLTGQAEIADKIRGLELGVDDYLTKPIYIKEILTRVRILLQKRDRSRFEQKKDNSTRFAGRLNDMGVVDLIQTIEVSRKTGVIHFRADEQRQATIFFKDGKVIDAEAGHLQGEDAVYRLLTWNDGDFEALFRPVRRRAVIEMSSQGLLMEGMRRLDEWGRLQEQLPPLSLKFEVVYDELWDRLAELPDDVNRILSLFDTRRTLEDVIDGSGIGDLEAVEVISKLYFEGIIVEVDPGKGLKSGSYPVEDLSLQDAARPEEALPMDLAPFGAAAAGSVKAKPRTKGSASEPSQAPSTRPVELAAAPPAAPPFPMLPDASTTTVTRSGLLEQAITDATPLTKSARSDNPHRTTTKGRAMARLALKKRPTTSEEKSDLYRPKTQPYGVLTSKEELDAAAHAADEELVKSAALKSSSAPLASGVAFEESAADSASGVAFEESAADSASGVAFEESAADSASGVAFEESAADRASGVASEESAAPLASGVAFEESAADSASGVASEESAADSASGVASEDDESIDIETMEDDEPFIDDDDNEEELPARSAVVSAEIYDGYEDEEDDRAEPALVVWYALAAVAAGLLAIVVFKGGDGDPPKAAPGVAMTTDAPLPTAPTTPDLLVTIPDAGRALAVLPADAAPVVTKTMPDAAVRVVAKAPADARPRKPAPDPIAAEPPPTTDAQIKTLQASARKAKRSGDRLEALLLLDQALELRRSSTSLFLKSEILLDLGDSRAALEVAQELTSSAPKRSKGWRILGMAHYEYKDYPAARQAFTRYLELAPKAKDAADVQLLLESL